MRLSTALQRTEVHKVSAACMVSASQYLQDVLQAYKLAPQGRLQQPAETSGQPTTESRPISRRSQLGRRLLQQCALDTELQTSGVLCQHTKRYTREHAAQVTRLLPGLSHCENSTFPATGRQRHAAAKPLLRALQFAQAAAATLPAQHVLELMCAWRQPRSCKCVQNSPQARTSSGKATPCWAPCFDTCL